jgi:hypothetical protein
MYDLEADHLMRVRSCVKVSGPGATERDVDDRYGVVRSLVEDEDYRFEITLIFWEIVLIAPL